MDAQLRILINTSHKVQEILKGSNPALRPMFVTMHMIRLDTERVKIYNAVQIKL